MKNLLYLGIILMLGSCGSNESSTNKLTKENEKLKLDMEKMSKSILELETKLESEVTVNVNGRKVSTVKIGNLKVMTEDLGDWNWNDAMKACADLGGGWRLPTKDELNVLYNNKDKIGGFVNDAYWSSEDDNDWFSAWLQGFDDEGYQQPIRKDYGYGVRAVRGF